MVSVEPDGVVMVVETGDGRWRVAVEPDGVTMVTSVWETGMVSVVVPPDEVKTLETVTELATGTEVVPPDEVTTETEVGVDETTDWVAYGELSMK
jgi:hypothetical protein